VEQVVVEMVEVQDLLLLTEQLTLEVVVEVQLMAQPLLLLFLEMVDQESL
jgi:hypothetical protein